MKRIYISHSKNYAFGEHLYKPIIESHLRDELDIILPYEVEGKVKNSKDIIAAVDMVIAEVSYPSTGQGIELGWADMLGKQIVGFYREGTQPSEGVKIIVPQLLSYKDDKEITEIIRNAALNRFSHER